MMLSLLIWGQAFRMFVGMLRRKDDILLKSAFEETFADLLRFCFNEANEIFDMERDFVFLDKELSELFPEVEQHGGSRFVDMLAKVFLKNGKEEWILVHVEIQGSNDKHFAERIFQYWYRIFDRFKVNVTTLAVFTGNKNQNRPSEYHRSFLGTEITFRYNAYHVLDHSKERLLSMDNPFALIVLAAQKALLKGRVPEEELNRQRLTVARALIKSRKYDHERISRFLYFLKQFVHVEDPKINRNFDKQIDSLTGRQNTMGIIETIKKIEREEGFERGIEKGAEQKSIEFVRNMLVNTDFSVDKIAALANVTEGFVKKVRTSLQKEE